MPNQTFNTLSERLLHALELTGTKKADLARAIDVKPQTINHLCHGDVRTSSFTYEIATVLGLNTRWLATGEGEMFQADDPKRKLFKDYKQIPLLNTEQLVLKAKRELNEDYEITDWVALKTKESNVFCTNMYDSSMSPLLPQHCQLFFKEIDLQSQSELKQESIVIAYVPNFSSLLIREIIRSNSQISLSPLNKDLFKEIQLTGDEIIFGEAIECHFRINTRQILR